MPRQLWKFALYFLVFIITAPTVWATESKAIHHGIDTSRNNAIIEVNLSSPKESKQKFSCGSAGLAPCAIVLIQSGASHVIQVKNNSTKVIARNITLRIAGTALENNLIVTNTCGSVAPKSSCTITVQPKNVVVGPTAVNIQGDNTAAVPAIVSVVAAATTLSVSPGTPQTLDTSTVSSSITFTVTNTGTVIAENVHMTTSMTLSFNSNTCSNINPGDTCTFNVSSVTPEVPGRISIQGTNTNAVLTPYIGISHGGGLVFSRVLGTPVGMATVKMVTPSDLNTNSQWIPTLYTAEVGVYVDSLSPCDGKNDGSCNTGKITTCLTTDNAGCIQSPGASISISDYAAGQCDQYSGGGFNDWYLPAICEWSNLDNSCTGQNIYTNLALTGLGGFADSYWSSTEALQTFALQRAWRQIFTPTASQADSNKHLDIGLRCVRQEVVTP